MTFVEGLIISLIAAVMAGAWLAGLVVGLRWIAAESRNVWRWAVTLTALVLGPVTSLVLAMWLGLGRKEVEKSRGTEPSIRVNLQQICQVIEKVAADNNLAEVQIDEDYFWAIHVSDLTNMSVRRPDVVIGSAFDSLEFMENSFAEDMTIPYTLIWAAELLTLVAHSQTAD